MTVTRESLRGHFGLLSDEELLNQFQSGELTELAHQVAGAELQRRNIDPPTPPPELPEPEVAPRAASDAQSNDEDLLLVGRFYNPVDAYLLQSRLDAEGVPAVVADALTYQNMAFGAGVVGGVRVLVPESYFERAAEIKNEIDRGALALDDKTDVR